MAKKPVGLVLAVQATSVHPITGEILRQPSPDRALAEVVFAAEALYPLLARLAWMSSDDGSYTFHLAAVSQAATQFRRLFDYGSDIDTLQGLATCCPLTIETRALIVNILSALDKIDPWLSGQLSDHNAPFAEHAAAIAQAASDLRATLGETESKLLFPPVERSVSSDLIPVKLPDIVFELRDLCIRVERFQPDQSLADDPSYWSRFRESAKRLCVLLPADIDLSDSTAQIRDSLRELKVLLAEIWSTYRLYEPTNSVPSGLEAWECKKLRRILSSLPIADAPSKLSAALDIRDAEGIQRIRSSEIGTMKTQALLKLLSSILDRGTGQEDDADIFEDLKHPELVKRFVEYLNQHRHFLGYCHIEQSHALNDKGVDILLHAEGGKIGFQLKSHFDASQDLFAANVKRQLAESYAHSLDHYFILICCPMKKVAKTDLGQKVSHLINELSQMKTDYHTTYGPLNTVRYFVGLPTPARDELLARKVIDDECLHDYEKGYEHLPEVHDDELAEAESALEAFGDDWFESKEGNAAFQRLEHLRHTKEAEQFKHYFLPTISAGVKGKRDSLIAEALSLLAGCRACKSWNEKSECKLPQWLDQVPEEMIPYTSLPNLLWIVGSLRDFRKVHQ